LKFFFLLLPVAFNHRLRRINSAAAIVPSWPCSRVRRRVSAHQGSDGCVVLPYGPTLTPSQTLFSPFYADPEISKAVDEKYGGFQAQEVPWSAGSLGCPMNRVAGPPVGPNLVVRDMRRSRKMPKCRAEEYVRPKSSRCPDGVDQIIVPAKSTIKKSRRIPSRQKGWNRNKSAPMPTWGSFICGRKR